MTPARAQGGDMHPAKLWKPLAGGKVQCRLCSHYCVLADGGRG